MKRSYKVVFSIITFFFFANVLYTQQVDLPVAPEAEAMKEYVDIPVDLYSGTPSVSFPIYTFQTRDLSVPITLSYHSNGNKVAEEASWVGLGWNLSAEGMITREIRGRDDFGGPATGDACAQNLPYEQSIPYLPQYPDPNGYPTYEFIYTYKEVSCTGGAGYECEFTSNDGANRTDEIFCEDYLPLPLDPEPDLFTYNIGGYSGKFMMNNQGSYVPITDHALSIEQVGSNAHPQWLLRTPDGVKYYFEQTIQCTYSQTQTLTYEIRDDGQLNNPDLSDDPCEFKQITTWYLDKIESPNGDKIYFVYDREEKGIKALPNFSEKRTENLRFCLAVGCAVEGIEEPGEVLTRSVTKTEYDGVYLREIHGEDEAYGKIVFGSSEGRNDLIGAKQLDTIDIYRPALIKRFGFDYEYFESTSDPSNKWLSQIPNNFNAIQSIVDNYVTEENTKKRLKLTGFREFKGDKFIPPHEFAYYQDEKLPAKTSFATDYWGFFNGAIDNMSFTPGAYVIVNPQPLNLILPLFGCEETEGFSLDGANREADPDKAKAWILNRITYPTRGISRLEFEGNEYNLPPGSEAYDPIPGGSAFLGQSLDAGNAYSITEENITIGDVRPTLNARVSLDVEVWDVAGDHSTPSCNYAVCQPDETVFRIDILNQQSVPPVSVLNEPIALKVPPFDYDNFVCHFFLDTTVLIPPGTYKVKLLNHQSCNFFPQNVSADVEVSWDEYEVRTSGTGGGLRVSSTEMDDGRDHVILKEFVYEENSGVMQNQPIHYEHYLYATELGFCDGGPGAITSTDRVIRHSNSQRTLANSLAGSFVGYGKVSVKHGGGAYGTTTTTFYNDVAVADDFPLGMPKGYNLKNGKVLQQEHFDDQGTKVREVINTYQSTLFDPIFGVFPKLSTDHQSNTPNVNRECYQYFDLFFYATIPQWHRVTSTEETDYFEGSSVTKTTSFTYNTTNYLVSSSSFVNSDNRIFKTEYSYPFDLPNHEFMVNRGVINPVLEEKLLVKGTDPGAEFQQVSGNKTTFMEYSQDRLIVADEIYNWEGQAYDLVGTFTEYNSEALPTRFDKNYYADDEEYEWFEVGNKKNLLKKKTYKDFIWQFDYKSSNRQLEQRTEPDGTYVRFDYDDLQRLYTIEPFGNGGTRKSTTTIAYHYGGPDDNTVFAETVYNDDEVLEKSNTKYYDGLGRYYKTITHKFVNEQDIVTDEIIFDNNGRVHQQTYLPGSLTTFEYEASPLSRLLKETYPDGEDKEFEYDGGGYYRNTVVDERGSPTTTLTEIVGRTYQIIDGEAGVTTYTYDDWGNILNIETPEGSYYTYSYLYDQNHLETKYVPGGGVTTYDYYDDKDLLKSETDANGNDLEYVYDEYDRIDEVLLGGITIVDNEWGQGSHVDKLASVTNDILSELSGNTTDSYEYDEFGRTNKYTFGHLSGTDITNYTYDMADRQIEALLDHNAAESHDFSHLNEFDRYDRLELSKYEVDGGGVKKVAAYTYNNRGELRTKVLGEELQNVNYSYHVRGWLKTINQYLGPGTPPGICGIVTTEDDNLTPDQPGYQDHMVIEDFLQKRLELTIQPMDSTICHPPVVCPTVECDSTELIAQQLSIDSVLVELEEQYATTTTIPCADGSVETTYTVEVNRFNFPTYLHRIRFCDKSELYILDPYLNDLSGDYQVMQVVQIDSFNQLIQVTVDEETTYQSLEAVVAMILYDVGFELNGYEQCDNPPDCVVERNCSDADLLRDSVLLNLLANEVPDIDTSLMQGDTIAIYQIVFCDGSLAYLLEEELSYLEGTGIPIVDTMFFTPDELIPIDDELPKNYAGDLYQLWLKYEPNGNIEEKRWQVHGRSQMRYEFEYDGLNRLLQADFSQRTGIGGSSAWIDLNQYGVFDIDYDGDGNLLTLKRNGPIDKCKGGLEFGLIDNLSYTYAGSQPNHLSSVTDAAIEKGFDGSNGSGDYSYDNNGNLTFDPYKGLTIEYNHLNLPKKVTGSDGILKIIYDASGRKLRMTGVGPTLDYINGVEYEGGFFGALYHDEGRITLSEQGGYHYFLRDHLGNTQVVFADKNGNGEIEPWLHEILQEDHYYPFGMHFEGEWYWAPFQFPGDGDEDLCIENGRIPYQYNNKEFIFKQELKWYDYGARYYDPATARWGQVDPLATSTPNWTPYRYGFNNPLRFTDPFGMTEDTYYNDGYGTWNATSTGVIGGFSVDDRIDIEKTTGKITVTQSGGDDVVQLVDNGKVLNSEVYGKNGSFQNDNQIYQLQSTVVPGVTSTIIMGTDGKALQVVYEVAAGSDVEFGKLDVSSNASPVESFVVTSHDKTSTPGLVDLVKPLSKVGFTGIKQSHSHPATITHYNESIPSGYFGSAKNNPNSLMPDLTTTGKPYGDAGNAIQVRSWKGFGNTKFEVYAPGNKTITTYDGVTRAKIGKK